MNLHMNGEENSTESKEMTLGGDNRRELTHEKLLTEIAVTNDNPGPEEEGPGKEVSDTDDGYPQDQVLPGVTRRWSALKCGSMNNGYKTQNSLSWTADAARQEMGNKPPILQGEHWMTPDGITVQRL